MDRARDPQIAIGDYVRAIGVQEQRGDPSFYQDQIGRVGRILRYSYGGNFLVEFSPGARNDDSTGKTSNDDWDVYQAKNLSYLDPESEELIPYITLELLQEIQK